MILCSWFVQYSVLYKRAFLSTLRNPAECAVRLLMCTWVCMCSGKLRSETWPMQQYTRENRIMFPFVLAILMVSGQLPSLEDKA